MNTGNNSKRRDAGVERLTLIFIGFLAIFYLIIYLKKPSLAIKGLKLGGAALIKTMPLIVGAFALAGLLQAIIPKTLFSRYLGPQQGLKGILLGSFLGGITPGPIYLVFPIASGMLKGGASIGVVIAYILAWDVCPLRRLPLEVALIGWKFVLVKFALSMPFPLLAGFFANVIFSKLTF